MKVVNEQAGRVNQKLRTRMAIVEACREVIRSGGPVTMPAVARAALVSEPTAYRYFPDLISLLIAALPGMWPSPADALEPVAASADPVERVAFASEFFLRRVLSYQGAVRAMISATITRPELATLRPGIRFGLISQALDPIAGTLPLPPERLAQLRHDLAAIISAEALFSLTDLCRLTADDAVASLIRTATTITAAATRDDNIYPLEARLTPLWRGDRYELQERVQAGEVTGLLARLALAPRHTVRRSSVIQFTAWCPCQRHAG